MHEVATVIVGAGHAGLAMSRCLSDRGIEHVLLERGEVVNSWRTERWESLTLLTPNWQSRLPGFGYQGDAPDAYRTLPETIDFLSAYARAIDAPVQTRTTVTRIGAAGGGYQVETDRGTWRCRSVVMASGACNIPTVPELATELPPAIISLTTQDYRRPDQLPDGGVMVVGASASGTQIADELHRSGRPVTLAVGEHIRVPRVYRGRDIQWWMDAAGVMDERYDEVDDINRARRVPSLQLTGTPTRRTLDLNALSDIGVKLVGRLTGVRETKVFFSGSLANKCALSDLKMNRLLTAIDEWATEAGLDGDVPPPCRLEPTRVAASPLLEMDLEAEGIRSILWATGYRPDFSWLDLPVFDRKGRIRHDGGIVEAPGLYLLGMPFLRRRRSALIDGAGVDAAELADHLQRWLGGVDQPAVAG